MRQPRWPDRFTVFLVAFSAGNLFQIWMQGMK